MIAAAIRSLRLRRPAALDSEAREVPADDCSRRMRARLVAALALTALLLGNCSQQYQLGPKSCESQTAGVAVLTPCT
jgi:hypothetical protein